MKALDTTQVNVNSQYQNKVKFESPGCKNVGIRTFSNKLIPVPQKASSKAFY